ncbi:MAG TPA: hypothetical protein VIF57_16325 [Polyangia bacterium]
MKLRDGSAPELGEAEEIDFELADADRDDAAPRAIHEPMQTAEIDVGRDRRVTLTSPIPAIMAESMVRERMPTPRSAPVTPPRDPAAPVPRAPEHTRRVGDSDKVHSGPVASPNAGEDVAPWRQRAAQRIDEARAALEIGDVTGAVGAAEAALRDADDAPAPGIVEVIEPARPLLNQVFATYVGPSNGLPILAPRADDIARRQLGERERALLKRIDGSRTLEELLDGSGLGPTDGLRVVARLIRSGAVRVV